jgi:hypothetical protein
MCLMINRIKMNLIGFYNYTDLVKNYLAEEEPMNPEQLRSVLNSFISQIVLSTGDFNLFIVSCRKTDELDPEYYQQVREQLNTKKLLFAKTDSQRIISFKEIERRIDLNSENPFEKLYMRVSKIDSMEFKDLKKHINELINLTLSLIHWLFIFIPYQTELISFEIKETLKDRDKLPPTLINDSPMDEWSSIDYEPFLQKSASTCFKLKGKYKSKLVQIKDAIVRFDKELTILHEDFVIDDFNSILFSEDFSSCTAVQFNIQNNQINRLFKILDQYFDGAILSVVQLSQKFKTKRGTIIKRTNLDSAKNRNSDLFEIQLLFDDFEKELGQIR